jgi:hypothetical protein
MYVRAEDPLSLPLFQHTPDPVGRPMAGYPQGAGGDEPFAFIYSFSDNGSGISHARLLARRSVCFVPSCTLTPEFSATHPILTHWVDSLGIVHEDKLAAMTSGKVQNPRTGVQDAADPIVAAVHEDASWNLSALNLLHEGQIGVALPAYLKRLPIQADVSRPKARDSLNDIREARAYSTSIWYVATVHRNDIGIGRRDESSRFCRNFHLRPIEV